MYICFKKRTVKEAMPFAFLPVPAQGKESDFPLWYDILIVVYVDEERIGVLLMALGTTEEVGLDS